MDKLSDDIQASLARIRELAAYRERSIGLRKKVPDLDRACRKFGINIHTVRRHWPELVEKWRDTEFHISAIVEAS